MKAYMAYSEYNSPIEGAILVFADDAKEAKKIAWASNTFVRDICDGEYTDLRIKWLKQFHWFVPLGDREKIAAGISHVIESPLSCPGCNYWGVDIATDGECMDCGEYVGDELCRVYGIVPRSDRAVIAAYDAGAVAYAELGR